MVGMLFETVLSCGVHESLHIPPSPPFLLVDDVLPCMSVDLCVPLWMPDLP